VPRSQTWLVRSRERRTRVFARVTIYDDVDITLEEVALEWASTEGLRISRALPGYRGVLTLVERDDRRLVEIGFYDSVDNARRADGLLGQVVPESLPDDLRRALPTQSYVGVFEVVERVGV
jgi:hypothetical protein